MLPLHFCTANADRSNGRLAPGLRRHPSTPDCNTFLPRKQDSYSWDGHTFLGLLQPWFLPPPEIFVSSPEPLFDAMSWIEVEKPRRFVVLHALVGCVGSGAKPCCRKKQSIGHPVSNLGKVGSALTIKIEGSTI